MSSLIRLISLNMLQAQIVRIASICQGKTGFKGKLENKEKDSFEKYDPPSGFWKAVITFYDEGRY